MSPGDVVSVEPADIRFKLSRDLDLGGWIGGDWDIDRRLPIETTDKHISIFQHFVDGVPWVDTDVFRGRYADVLRRKGSVRGYPTLTRLAEHYRDHVDTVFVDLKVNGFRTHRKHKALSLPKVHIGRDGTVLLGNQGNHRVAMAKVLGLSLIAARVHTIHSEFWVSV